MGPCFSLLAPSALMKMIFSLIGSRSLLLLLIGLGLLISSGCGKDNTPTAPAPGSVADYVKENPNTGEEDEEPSDEDEATAGDAE